MLYVCTFPLRRSGDALWRRPIAEPNYDNDTVVFYVQGHGGEKEEDFILNFLFTCPLTG
jgi:hypothetical protein